MFVTIMRTVRISDLRRGHLRAGFVPWLQVGFFPRSESAGCTIVTIEPPSPDRLSAGPYIYVRSARTRVRALQSPSLHAVSSDNRIQAYSTRNRPVFGPG